MRQDRIKSFALAGFVVASGVAGAGGAAALGWEPVLPGLLMALAVFAALAHRGRTYATRRLVAVERRLDDVAAMSALEMGLGTGRSILPWSDRALPAGTILRVASILRERRSPRVIECGAGVSTILLAHQMRVLGTGHLWTLEDDPAWAATVQGLVDEHGLGGHVTLVVAPLAEVSVAGQSVRLVRPAGAGIRLCPARRRSAAHRWSGGAAAAGRAIPRAAAPPRDSLGRPSRPARRRVPAGRARNRASLVRGRRLDSGSRHDHTRALPSASHDSDSRGPGGQRGARIVCPSHPVSASGRRSPTVPGWAVVSNRPPRCSRPPNCAG